MLKFATVYDEALLPLANCKNLEKLFLVGFRYISDNAIATIAKSCTQLLKVDLTTSQAGTLGILGCKSLVIFDRSESIGRALSQIENCLIAQMRACLR
jgi:hypothetical protein